MDAHNLSVGKGGVQGKEPVHPVGRYQADILIPENAVPVDADAGFLSRKGDGVHPFTRASQHIAGHLVVSHV